MDKTYKVFFRIEGRGIIPQKEEKNDNKIMITKRYENHTELLFYKIYYMIFL